MSKDQTQTQEPQGDFQDPNAAFVDEGLLAQWDTPDVEEEETEEEDLSGEHGEEAEAEGHEEGQEQEEVVPKKYKVRGKEYSLEDLQSQGLLDNLITQAEQQVHYQDLYHTVKQQIDEIKQYQQQQQQQVRPQQPQPVQAEQVVAAMQPHVAQAVHEGFLEGEFASEFPRTASAQMFIYNDYLQLKQVVAGMYNYFMREQADRAYKGIRQTFDTSCDTLVNQHPVYQNLKTPDEREKFFDFLKTTVNPEAGAINLEFLARQYLAYQQDHILPTLQNTRQQIAGKKKTKRKLAVGEGTPAPRGNPKAPRTTDETVMDSLLAHFGS
jgi:hypothetical protein